MRSQWEREGLYCAVRVVEEGDAAATEAVGRPTPGGRAG